MPSFFIIALISRFLEGFLQIRWIASSDKDPRDLNLTSDTKWVQDFKGNDFLLFNSEWHISHTLDQNEGLELVEFGH